MINLITCNTSFEANLIMGMLKNNGIACFLTNENYTNLMPNALLGSGIQVMIDESDLDKALKLLAETRNASAEEEVIVCPNCHSGNVVLSPNNLKKLLFILIGLFSLTPPGNFTNIYLCNDCGKTFK